MATAILRFPTSRARTTLAPTRPPAPPVLDGLLQDAFAGLATGTVRTYRQQLGAFASWLGCTLEELPTALLGGGRGLATQQIRRYRAALLDRGLAPSTVNGAVAAIRSLVRTLFDSALRSNELTTLHLEHVECDAQGVPIALYILAKGHRARQRLTLTPAASVAIARWLNVRGPLAGSLYGLGNRGVAKLLDRLGAAAGIGHIRPHGLRHTSLTAALEATNGDIVRVLAFSRHKKVETVLRYNDHRCNLAGAVAAVVSDLV